MEETMEVRELRALNRLCDDWAVLARYRKHDPVLLAKRVIAPHLDEKRIQEMRTAQPAEWGEFRRHVSSWERERYLEVY
jgi:hypothetical protein